MTDIVLPLALKHARNSFRYIEQTGVTRGVYTGAAQTVNFGGDRVGLTIDFTPHGGASTTGKSERRQLQSSFMSLRGKQNRLYATDNSYVQGGTFPATELFTNIDLNGTTGWSVNGGVLTDLGGAIRLTANQAVVNINVNQAITLAAYVPYALRSLFTGGKGFSGLSLGPYQTDAVGNFASNLSTTRGYLVSSGVSTAAGGGGGYAGIFTASTGMISGDYVDLRFASFARCIQADGGANLALQSDAFSNASWTKTRATVTADNGVAPDGTTTADTITEDSSNNTHFVEQAVTVPATTLDYCFSVALMLGTRTAARIQMTESTGSHIAYLDVNLSTGGAAVAISGGANWTNVRGFASNIGGSWYQVTVIARKASAATSITCAILLANPSGTISYLGNGAGYIVAWRATLSQSSMPVRLRSTTTVAVAADSQTASALYVKGLPVSTTGLLLAGDWVEIDGQIKMVTTSLDSDASGLGYLQFSPPLRRSLADNSPIHVNKPMGRFLLAGDSSGWSNEPGFISSGSIELEEAFT